MPTNRSSSPSAAQQYNRRGVLHKRRQEYREAAACYERAIELQPSLAEAHFNLGLLRRDLGRVEEAVGCFEEALRHRPQELQIQIQYASTLASNGGGAAALQVLQDARSRHGDTAELLFETANVHHVRREWEQARYCYEATLAIQPELLSAHINLGNTLREQGDLTAAESAYRRALRLAPQSAAAHTNLGQIYRARGDMDEALRACEDAARYEPRSWEAQINLGNIHLDQGSFERAVECFGVAVQLRPQASLSHIRLGQALTGLEQYTDAAKCFECALETDPTNGEAATELGSLLVRVGEIHKAREFYELASHLDGSTLAKLRAALALPIAFETAQEQEECWEKANHAIFQHAGAALSIAPSHVCGSLVEAPFAAQFFGGSLREFKVRCAAVYGQYFSEVAESLDLESPPRPRLASRPKVGIVVTPGHEFGFTHSLGDVVKQIDNTKIEVTILCSESRKRRLEECFDSDRTPIVGFPSRFDLVARFLAELQLDVLYYWEVGTDPLNYFLPFLRLAPVQCTSWGVQVTSGIPTMDYYLGSALVEAEGAANDYSEHLICGDSLLTGQRALSLPIPVRGRESFGLSQNWNLYGCLQNVGKLHIDGDARFAEILRRDDRGRLLLLRDRFGKSANVVEQRLQRNHPDIFDRILFLDSLAAGDYVSLLANCDVVLDPPHFGGVNTTFDAISLDKPVVTQPTDQQRGRFTAACFELMGVDDSIAVDLDDYVDRAVQLGTNDDYRQFLCERIRETKELVFDRSSAVLEHERLFQEMCEAVR